MVEVQFVDHVQVIYIWPEILLGCWLEGRFCSRRTFCKFYLLLIHVTYAGRKSLAVIIWMVGGEG